MDFLGKALKISAKRQGILTADVANLDTVGFKPKDIDFKTALDNAMDSGQSGNLTRTDPRHYAGGLPAGASEAAHVEVSSQTMNIDQEMTRLAENNIQYRTSLEMLLRKMSMVKTAITEGR
jgi:flagellar basal-body rod protein FlgB